MIDEDDTFLMGATTIVRYGSKQLLENGGGMLAVWGGEEDYRETRLFSQAIF